MELRKDKDVCILKITSDDLSDPRETSRVVEDLLTVDGEKKLIVDLSEIETIYSLQIGTLVTLHCLCYENVAIMKLAGANERVKDLLRMVGLETLIEIHHGTEVARQSFGTPPSKPSDPRVKK